MPRRTTVGNAEALFELYEQKMYRVAYAILHDEGQAEDAVMAAFEKILRGCGVPEDPAGDDAKRLVIAAVRSAAIDQYRANARERERSLLVDDVEACEGARGIGGDPIGEHMERTHAHELVESLPAHYADVLRERFLNDRSAREAAERLGISESNVRKRQERAIAALRDNERGQGNEKLFACR